MDPLPDDFNPNAPEPAPEPYPSEVDAIALLDRLLAHFQVHRIDDVPAVIAVLEDALDSEYRRGVEEAAGMTRRTKSILDTPLPEWTLYEQHPMREKGR